MVSGNEGDNRLSHDQGAGKGKKEKSSTQQALADQLWGLFQSAALLGSGQSCLFSPASPVQRLEQ